MLRDPQGWNLYVYGRNNPLRFIDSNGEAILLSGDDEQRKKQLAAVQAAVGKQAGSYLYDNAVTDKKGDIHHYIGIYTNGKDGKSAEFSTLNAASKVISQIIVNQKTAALYVVQPYDSLPGERSGKNLSLSEQHAYGITYPGSPINIYVQDPSQHIDPVEGWKMSNGMPAIQTYGTNTGHELGHAWGFMKGIFNDGPNEKEALDLENKVRTLKNPNAPIRKEH